MRLYSIGPYLEALTDCLQFISFLWEDEVWFSFFTYYTVSYVEVFEYLIIVLVVLVATLAV